MLHLPGPGLRRPRLRRRPTATATSCATSSGSSTRGRLAGTGYVSILPVDQGIEHSAGASFAPNPMYFDPENLVAPRRRGRLQRVRLDVRRARRDQPQVGAQVPLHREAQPQRAADVPQRVRPGHVRQRSSGRGTWARPASARRSTSAPSTAAARSSRSPSRSRRPTGSGCSPCCGATCATRASSSTAPTTTCPPTSRGQANHLGVTIQADIIKQKLPENNGGYNALNQNGGSYGKTNKQVYAELTTRQPDRPHPLPAPQLLRRAASPLINSRRRVVGRERPGRGRAHRGRQQARRRHRPDLRPQGVPAPDGRGHRPAHAIQDVYLSPEVTIA